MRLIVVASVGKLGGWWRHMVTNRMLDRRVAITVFQA
jgi:hypothetical protein